MEGRESETFAVDVGYDVTARVSSSTHCLDCDEFRIDRRHFLFGGRECGQRLTKGLIGKAYEKVASREREGLQKESRRDTAAFARRLNRIKRSGNGIKGGKHH